MASVAAHSQTRLGEPQQSMIAALLETPVLHLVGLCLVAGCAFFNVANVIVDKEEVGLDLQVLIKLGMIGCGGLYGFYGFISRPRVRQTVLSFPVAWILIIAVFYFVAIPFSPFPRNAIVSTCSVIAILLLMITALDETGLERVLVAMFLGMTAFIVGSWYVYFVHPEIGILAEPITKGEFAYRMSGLAHANTLGQVSGLTVVFTAVAVFTYRRRSPLIVLVGLLALAALVNSLSRTSLIACVASLLFGYRHLYLKKEYSLFFLTGGLAIILGLLVLNTQVDLAAKAEQKLELLSKSGESDELTTATGRSEIWAHAIFLLADRPLTGYGAATQKYFFEDHSLYTHNLVLNVAFSGGIFAGFAAILMIIGRVRRLFVQSYPLADAIAVFIIVNGLFENVIFSILAGLPTMLWILCLAWPQYSNEHETQGAKATQSKSRFLCLEKP